MCNYKHRDQLMHRHRWKILRGDLLVHHFRRALLHRYKTKIEFYSEQFMWSGNLLESPQLFSHQNEFEQKIHFAVWGREMVCSFFQLIFANKVKCFATMVLHWIWCNLKRTNRKIHEFSPVNIMSNRPIKDFPCAAFSSKRKLTFLQFLMPLSFRSGLFIG